MTSRANIDYVNLGDYMKLVFAKFKDALKVLKRRNPVPLDSHHQQEESSLETDSEQPPPIQEPANFEIMHLTKK